MDILLIIYIFALFVIFSPNFIFKYSQSNNIYTSLIHALIFSIVIYITYNSVVKSETEGATIGSFNKNNEYYPLGVDEMNLGTINAEPPTIENPKDVTYNNDIIVSTPNTAEEQRLTAMPAYDYSNFRTYDYENMKKKIDMLETHQHTNHYFDLVPNFNATKHEILCAADYGTNKPCCRQPNADIPEINQCGALKPFCQDYIAGVQWGKCVSTNPYPKPNLVYDGPKNDTNNDSDKNNVVVKDTSGKDVSVNISPDGSIIVPNCPSTTQNGVTETQTTNSGTAGGVNESKSNTLTNTNETLLKNEYLVSNNKEYFAIMQGDGNFVTYKGSGPDNNKGVFWASSTAGEESFAIMQSDGNFVIYKGSGPSNNLGFKWGTMTQNNGVKVTLEDNGQLNVYNASNQVIWSKP